MPKTASPSEGSSEGGKSRQNFNYITMKKLGKLNLKKEKMLSHEELVSFRGGGSCGYKDVDGVWQCNTEYYDTYDAVKDLFAEGAALGWCCDSCSTVC